MSLPHISMPRPFHVSVPKAPKIASVHVAKISNGFKVQHVMHNAPTRTFAFQDPQKMIQHLRRIQSSQWREPNRNEGTAMAHTLDLQT